MKVQINKRADGSGVLRCIRADGSATWQKQTDRHAAFFALHDLTHFAVETTLGYRRGFFGLIAEGWEIDDTTGKGARGPLPPEAGEVEELVGLAGLGQQNTRQRPTMLENVEIPEFSVVSWVRCHIRPLMSEY